MNGVAAPALRLGDARGGGSRSYTGTVRLAWLVTLCGVTGLLGGCGQKGPLVLPAARTRTKVPAQLPVPAASAADKNNPAAATGAPQP